MAKSEKLRARCTRCGQKGNVTPERLSEPIKCPNCGLIAHWEEFDDTPPVRIELPKPKTALPAAKPIIARPRARTGTPPSGNTVHVDAERIESDYSRTCPQCGLKAEFVPRGRDGDDGVLLGLPGLFGAGIIIYALIKPGSWEPQQTDFYPPLIAAFVVSTVFVFCISWMRERALVCAECGAAIPGKTSQLGDACWFIISAATWSCGCIVGVGLLGWVLIGITALSVTGERIGRYTQRERVAICGCGMSPREWTILILLCFPLAYPAWRMYARYFPHPDWQLLAERQGYFGAQLGAV